MGITNSIAADTIVIGNESSSGALLRFNPAFTNITTPALYLRGHSSSRVTTFNISDQSSATANIGSVSSGVVDFSGGTIDAMVSAMTLAWGQPIAGSGAGTATGTFNMAAGPLNVNTLDIAIQTNAAVTGSASTGTVNISGGTNIVNTFLRLAYYGGGTNTINLSGGKLIVSNSIGSVASPLSAFAVSSGATLKFPVVSGVTPVVANNFSSDSSGGINISSLPAIPGYPSQFPLISYQAGGSGATFSLSQLPGTFTGYIFNDNSSTIWLVITNGPSLASVLWGGGVNNLWDTNSLNWTNNANAVKYQDLDAVTLIAYNGHYGLVLLGDIPTIVDLFQGSA